jgi:hypothetical protein
MSGYLAGKVWHSALDADLKPLAATLADIADDDGTSIYPSIEFVAWRLSCSRASVDRGLRELRDAKILEVVSQGGGRGKTTEYQLVEEKLPKRPPWKPRQIDVVSKETTSDSTETTSDLRETTSNNGLNHVRAVTQDSSLPVRDSSVTRHANFTDLDDSTSEETSTPPSRIEVNPVLSYRAAKNIYRKYCHKNLGSLNEAFGETWIGLIGQHGEKIVLGALELWAKEMGDRGKNLGYPIAVFLKNSDEHIEAYEIESTPALAGKDEEEVDDGTEEYLAMIRREKAKLNRKNG